MIHVTGKTGNTFRSLLMAIGRTIVVSMLVLSGGQLYAMDITVVLGARTAPYQKFLESFRHEFDKHTATEQINIRVLSADKLTTNDLLNPGELIVSVGRKAAKKISSYQHSSAILYSLLPDYYFRETIDTGSTQCRKFSCSAVYLDQPATRQIALIKAVLPETRRIGVLLGRYSSGRKDELQAAGRKLDVELVLKQIPTIERFASDYEQLLEDTDAILALPDPGVFNRSTVKNILLTSYRYRKPLFGFSQAYVNAGATAAVYSTPELVARQTAGLVLEFSGKPENGLADPQYSRFYNVLSNRRVVRSLGLRAAEDEVLRQKLEEILNDR